MLSGGLSGGGMSHFSASRGGSPIPIPPLGEPLLLWDRRIDIRVKWGEESSLVHQDHITPYLEKRERLHWPVRGRELI